MKSPQTRDKPVLLVDVDGVISLFGFAPNERPAGTWHQVEGIVHLLSAGAAEHLHALDGWFELVWCTGWEEKASEHLPALIGAPRLPHVALDRHARPGASTAGHFKLGAIDAHVGRERPLAWVDDALDEECERWAAARAAQGAPTHLERTDPAVGLTGEGVGRLVAWARSLHAPAVAPVGAGRAG